MRKSHPPIRQGPTLYQVYAAALGNGSTVEDTVAAGDEHDAYQKARISYPCDRY